MNKVNNKNIPRVCLIVDNPLRDLDGMVLLGWHLASRDAEVYLVSMSHKNEVFFIRPDIVVLNYVRKGNAKFIKICKQLGILIGVIDTEGGVLKDVDSVFNRIFNYTDRVDLYCLWGLKQYDALRKTDKLTDDEIKLTGCPRYDFCASPWNSSLPDIHISYEKKMVLINTNFPIIQPRFQSADREARELVRDAGFEKNYVGNLLAETRYARDEVVNAVKHISSRFPDTLFVVRPHPFEDKSYYTEIFGEYPNVEVHQSGSVFPWIKRAVVTLHHNCATAIETVMTGKEAIHLEWINTPLLTQFASVDVSLLAGSLEKLESMLEKILKGQPLAVSQDKTEARRKIISDWFYACDGKNSERAALAILSTIQRAGQWKLKKAVLIKALIVDQIIERHYKTALKHLLILIAGEHIVSMMKKMRYVSGKEFNVEDVQVVLSRLADAAGKQCSVEAGESITQRRYTRFAVRIARA